MASLKVISLSALTCTAPVPEVLATETAANIKLQSYQEPQLAIFHSTYKFNFLNFHFS